MTQIPLLKMFAKLLHCKEGRENWMYEVYVTDNKLETYKILWETKPRGEPDQNEVQARFVQSFEDFERVDTY